MVTAQPVQSYNNANLIPARGGRRVDNTNCGTVVLWSLKDRERDSVTELLYQYQPSILIIILTNTQHFKSLKVCRVKSLSYYFLKNKYFSGKIFVTFSKSDVTNMDKMWKVRNFN